MTPFLRTIDPEGVQLRTMGQRYAELAFAHYPNDDVPDDALERIEIATRESLWPIVVKHGGTRDDLTAGIAFVASEFARCYLALQLAARPVAGNA